MKIYIFFKLYICLALINILFYIYVYINHVSYISQKNSLCYSWIPYNRYEITTSLCQINCSYIRLKPYPSNSPFKCKDKFSLSNNNISYKIYIFNTSTYGKYVKQYRFFYGNYYV